MKTLGIEVGAKNTGQCSAEDESPSMLPFSWHFLFSAETSLQIFWHQGQNLIDVDASGLGILDYFWADHRYIWPQRKLY